ncbi:MAG: hypothetical protein HRU25_14615 [Psychrobium sp.]|nr:hypothetical protein [Psychrobium sp.]
MKTYVIKMTATVYQLSGQVLRKNDQNKLICLVVGDIITVDESLLINVGDSVLLVFSDGSMLPLDHSTIKLDASLCILDDDSEMGSGQHEKKTEIAYQVPNLSEYKHWDEQQDLSIPLDTAVLSNNTSEQILNSSVNTAEKHLDIDELIASSDQHPVEQDHLLETNEHQLDDLLEHYFCDPEFIPPLVK